jgi:hypothetical protein
MRDISDFMEQSVGVTEKGFGKGRIEMCPGAGPDNGFRSLQGERLFIWTFRGQCVENINYGKNPRDSRNLFPSDSVRIAGAIEFLVMPPITLWAFFNH